MNAHTQSPLLDVAPLTYPWQTFEPFLLCAYLDDAYPAGNEDAGPDSSLLRGRQVGSDWERVDGWRMYHGATVPGFPQHPHRGFETITIVERGFVDHADSLGATARYGPGDTQWLTTGQGLSHSEMYPLLSRDTANPLELFQIWLNLPAKHKLAAPGFSMRWREETPVYHRRDASGRWTTVAVIAGSFAGLAAPPPPPESWASVDSSDVAIWTMKLETGASLRLPAAGPGTNRALYFYRGASLKVSGRTVPVGQRILLRAEETVDLENGEQDSELLLLQAKPIGEPVAQHGPFVMNSRAELEQAHRDYAQGRFGGWPWPTQGPVHARNRGRFANHPDGRSEIRDVNDPADPV